MDVPGVQRMTDDTRAPLTAQEITELRAWLGGWRDGAARAAAAAERDPDSYEHAHRYVQRMAATSLRALDELEALRQTVDGWRWEADHQRSVLLHVDGEWGTTLAEEFPFGCDSIELVAEALVDARIRLAAVEAERDRLADRGK